MNIGLIVLLISQIILLIYTGWNIYVSSRLNKGGTQYPTNSEFKEKCNITHKTISNMRIIDITVLIMGTISLIFAIILILHVK